MHVMKLTITCVLLSIGGGILPAGAQSLADVARKEENRRQAIKQPSKVLTNKDLGSVPPATPAGAEKPAAAEKSAAEKSAAENAEKGTTTDKEPAKRDGEPVKDEKYWAGRLKALQSQLERDQALGEALQTRINALTADFVNRDNPVQRAGIERDRQKALVESIHLETAIQNDKKSLVDFQEEARRAGVPPGWLR
jgi:hypothetical protein